VSKYNVGGNELWTLPIATDGIEVAEGVRTNAGEVYVAGWTTGVFPAQTNLGGFDAFVLKLTFEQPNTIAGGNVTVQPTDTTTMTSPASVTFSEVTQAGWTDLTIGDVGPVPPAGFSLGQPPAYYNLTTLALFSGPIQVCINYAGTFGDSSGLRLFHFEGGEWIDRTTSLDMVSRTICGIVSSLSPFAILRAPVARVQEPIDPNGSSVFRSKKGVVPVRFTLSLGGQLTCELPSATIAVSRTSGIAPGLVNETEYLTPADGGSNFRIAGCQYLYNLGTSSLGQGSYRVDIKIAGTVVGSGTFGLK
jgi:hypothetical protein